MSPTREHVPIDGIALSGPQRQGDVLVLPAFVVAKVPATGTPVVRGDNMADNHVVCGVGGPVYCDPVALRGDYLRVAILTVPDGSTAYLKHPEHDYLAIAPGSYQIRRQREFAGSTRTVAD